MTTRTSSKTVVFTRPFWLSAVTYWLPAGSYTVETDEERLDSASVTAFRRLRTLIRVPLASGAAGSSSQIMIDPTELEAALARDGAPEQHGPETLDDYTARAESRP